MSIIQPEDRYQQQLFSSLDEQLDPESIVRLIDVIIDKIYENKKIEQVKTNDVGRPEYPRSSLLKLYVYGYMNRVKSSRKLERECKVNLEVLWLMGKMQPDHWTISNYRKENQAEIKQAVKQFVKFLKESGYLEGETVVIDGTKLKANASSTNTTSIDAIKERLEDIDNKIIYYLDTIEQEDEKTEEIEKLKKEKEELVKEIEKLKAEKKRAYIKTDPDANIMKTQRGKVIGYNIQLSCDRKNKLIVSTDVSSQTNDFKQLRNMYEKSRVMLGNKPSEIIADAGYYSPEEIQSLEEGEKVKAYVAELPEQTKGEFRYDKQKDEYVCIQGKKLKFEKQKYNSRGRKTRVYRCNECEGCPVRKQCTISIHGRTKIRYINQEFRDNHRERMREKESKAKIRLRKAIIEHTFGTIKLWLGKNPLLLRGIEKVHTEIRLVSFSYNLLRIYNIDGFESLLEKINRYNWKLAS